MKIRIQGNSLRLRLSEAEVQQFGQTGRLTEVIAFGPLPENKLHYTLAEVAEISEVDLIFKNNTITVQIPSAQALIWVNSRQTSLAAQIPNGQPAGLKILIEKDLNCSHEKRQDA